MNIDRHNYEEYFILYLDEELTAEDKQQVDSFVAQNPDLKTELELLLSSKLMPEEQISFGDKNSLLRFSNTSSINANNCEEWFVLYIDNELDAAGRLEVESFVAADPVMRERLEILSRTVSIPSEIRFPNKETLYRREEKKRPVAYMFTMRRIAVAASLVLAVSTTAILISKNKTSVAEGQVALNTKTATPSESAKVPDQNTPAPVESMTVTGTPAIVPNTVEVVSSPATDVAVAKVIKASGQDVNAKPATNNLPLPIHNPNMIEKAPVQDQLLARLETPANNALTNPKEINDPALVTPGNIRPLQDISAATNTDQVIAAGYTEVGEQAPKNKLRGFFRKVTRTFEKATNIKATDDEDRLLVGSLAIRL